MISQPSGGDFITILDVNREVSHGLRSLGLEINLFSRPGLFSLKHEYGLMRHLLQIPLASYLSLK